MNWGFKGCGRFRQDGAVGGAFVAEENGMCRGRGRRNLGCSGKTVQLGDNARQERGTEEEGLSLRSEGAEKQWVIWMISLAFYLGFA